MPTTRRDLTLDEKMSLIEDRDNGMTYRALADKYKISLGSVTNILKRREEYVADYEHNDNKETKRKTKNATQQIDKAVYEWFCSQRVKKIPISGPILQERVRQIAKELGFPSGQFKASNGWLNRFQRRHSVAFRTISGESATVNPHTVEEWKQRLPTLLEKYDENDVFNCDETGLFFKALPDKSFVFKKEECKGGKRSKERYTVLLCANWSGREKLKPVVISKSARPRCFKNVDMNKLPVLWRSNRTAWMTRKLFTEWLAELNRTMHKRQRNILLCLDNAPCHPSDNSLANVELLFFPPNTTSVIQPLAQGVIHSFKAHYRKHLVTHVINQCAAARSVEDIVVSALDAVNWIDSAWHVVTEVTIRHTFATAGFIRPSVLREQSTITTDNDTETGVEVLQRLNLLLQHVQIGGQHMTAEQFVDIDKEIPSFDEWNDDSEGLSVINIIPPEHEEERDQPQQSPPTLTEALDMIRRLHILSSAEYPQLYQDVSQLESKLVDIYLERKTSKQSTIHDFFKRT